MLALQYSLQVLLTLYLGILLNGYLSISTHVYLSLHLFIYLCIPMSTQGLLLTSLLFTSSANSFLDFTEVDPFLPQERGG